MSVNIDSFFLVSKYAGPYMAKNKNGGSIINHFFNLWYSGPR